MKDRYLLRTAVGQEYFSTKEELIVRVLMLLDSESSIGMYLQRYPAEFGDKPDTHTGAVVSADEQEVQPVPEVPAAPVKPSASTPTLDPAPWYPPDDMRSFEYRAA